MGARNLFTPRTQPDYKIRGTDPDLKEHVISVLRSATIDSATDRTITEVVNNEDRECSLLDVQQAGAELVEKKRIRRLNVEKLPRSRRYELVREEPKRSIKPLDSGQIDLGRSTDSQTKA